MLVLLDHGWSMGDRLELRNSLVCSLLCMVASVQWLKMTWVSMFRRRKAMRSLIPKITPVTPVRPTTIRFGSLVVTPLVYGASVIAGMVLL